MTPKSSVYTHSISLRKGSPTKKNSELLLSSAHCPNRKRDKWPDKYERASGDNQTACFPWRLCCRSQDMRCHPWDTRAGQMWEDEGGTEEKANRTRSEMGRVWEKIQVSDEEKKISKYFGSPMGRRGVPFNSCYTGRDNHLTSSLRFYQRIQTACN